MTTKRPALDLLNDIGKGKLAHELTEALHDLVAACLDTGRKGTVQLALTIEPDKNAPRERFNVAHVIVAKTPRVAARPSMFFVTDDGNLSRTDPRQERFEPLRSLDGTTVDDADTGATTTSSSRKAN